MRNPPPRNSKTLSSQTPTENPDTGVVAAEPSSHRLLKYILVLGPPQCGKSSLIDIACKLKEPQPRSPTGLPPTLEFRTFPTCEIGGHDIKFIDSPGLGDPTRVQETLSKLVEHLAHGLPQHRPIRLTGILYIHPEGDGLAGQPLWRNLQMLRALIGEQFLQRFTILVNPEGENWQVDAIRNSITNTRSPFHPFYRANPNLKVVVSNLNRDSIDDAVRSYSLVPQRFFAQDNISRGVWDIKQIISYLQQLPDEYTKDHSGTPRQTTMPPSQKEALDAEHDKLPDPIHMKAGDEDNDGDERSQGQGDQEAESLLGSGQQQGLEETNENLPSTREGENTKPAYMDQIEKLTTKLEQTQVEYASLRSHLQIHDNIEHGQITQTLDDINRLIDDLGQSISEYVVDGYSEAISPIQLEALEPQRFQKLVDMFGYTSGRSSLMKSSSALFPDLEDFLYYAIRAVLCSQLYKLVFEPFHPNLAGRDYRQQNDFIVEVYKQIARQEHQSVAGRWRKDTFNSISNNPALSRQVHPNTTRQIISNSLSDLIGVFFDHRVDGLLTEEHTTMLNKLIAMAEDWNRLTRGSVVFHGDFQPIVYPYGENFQPSLMSEFGAKSNDTNCPKFNLATIELGLIKYYALGGNQEPEMTVPRKAVTASEKLLFRRNL